MVNRKQHGQFIIKGGIRLTMGLGPRRTALFNLIVIFRRNTCVTQFHHLLGQVLNKAGLMCFIGKQAQLGRGQLFDNRRDDHRQARWRNAGRIKGRDVAQ